MFYDRIENEPPTDAEPTQEPLPGEPDGNKSN